MDLRQRLILVVAKSLGALLVVLVGIGAIYVAAGAWTSEVNSTEPVEVGYNGEFCNVAVVPLQGEIVAYDGLQIDSSQTPSDTTSGDAVVAAINAADANPDIKGVVLQVDSGGGEPAPSEQIMKALLREKIPTAAYIREAGDSGAYMAATGANTIIATNYADVGSIGVTESYVQNSEQNAKNGLQFISLSSGPYKDALNPDNPITPEQKAQAQQQIDDLAQIFVNEVAANRHLTVDAVKALADGSSETSAQALKNKLVDQVGDDTDVAKWFTGKIGTDAVLCKPSL